MLIDKWVQCGNILIGYVFDCPGIPRGAWCETSAIRNSDYQHFAECLDGYYKLGEPGDENDIKKAQEYFRNNLIARVDDSVFLNPNG